MKRRGVLLIFLITCPVLVGARIYQLLNTIDPSNGFYLASQRPIAYAITAATVLLSLIFFIIGFMSKKTPDSRPAEKSISLGLASLLVALGIFADVVLDFKDSFAVNANIGILSVISIIAAIIFLIEGKRLFKGEGINSTITIVPLAWALIRLFIKYTADFNGKPLISENIYDIIMLCCIMMFLLYRSHISLASNIKKSRSLMIGFGLTGALLSFITVLSRIVILAMGKSNVLSHSDNLSLANLALGIYILIYVYQSLRDCKNADYICEDTEPEEEYVPQFDDDINLYDVIDSDDTDNEEIMTEDVCDKSVDESSYQNVDESNQEKSSKSTIEDLYEEYMKEKEDEGEE